MKFKGVHKPQKLCYYHRHSSFESIEGQRLTLCNNFRNQSSIQNFRSSKFLHNLLKAAVHKNRNLSEGNFTLKIDYNEIVSCTCKGLIVRLTTEVTKLKSTGNFCQMLFDFGFGSFFRVSEL